MLASLPSTTTPTGGLFDNVSDSDVRELQRLYPYFSVLPFPVESEADRLRHLNRITDSIYIAMSMKTLPTPSLMYWTRELHGWLDLKFDMPPTVRTKLIAVYYELALSHGIQRSAVEAFVQMLCLLTEKKYLVDYSTLSLDWKPLIAVGKKICLADFRQATPRPSLDFPSFQRLASSCQHFFPPEAITNILDELLPLFSAEHSDQAQQVLGLLTAITPIQKISDSFASLYFEQVVPAFFHLWTLNSRSGKYELMMMDFLAGICCAGLKSPQISFGAYGVLTRDQSATMLTSTLRLLEIPIGKAGSPFVKMRESRDFLQAREIRICTAISKWIVYSLSPESLSAKSSILSDFKGLIQSVETFFHPSNYGSWSKLLTRLLATITDHFMERWAQERSGELEISESRRLTTEIRHEFVSILKSSTFSGIYSKSPSGSTLSLKALQVLAYLEPDLILPPLLAQNYSALQGLVETHRTITALKSLTLVSRPLIMNKPWRAHATALLGLALPGIDANDLTKSVHSLEFMQSMAAYMPFADLSDGIGPNIAMEYITGSIEVLENMIEGENYSALGLVDEDEITVVKSSTATFADFVVSLMGKIFSLLENLPDTSSTQRRASQEQSVVNAIPSSFHVILPSLSDELLVLAFDQYTKFITSHVLPQATDVAGNLLSCFAYAKPDLAFSQLLSVLIGNIKEEIEENHAGQSKSREPEPRDRTLVWYLSLLRKLTWLTGDMVFKYRDELFDFVLYAREKVHGAASIHTAYLVHHILYSVTNYYPLNGGLINKSGSYEKGYTLDDWGHQIEPADLKIEWHVVTSEKMNFASTFYQSMVDYSSNALEYATSPNMKIPEQDWSEEIVRQTTFLRMAISGMSITFDPKQISQSAPKQECLASEETVKCDNRDNYESPEEVLAEEPVPDSIADEYEDEDGESADEEEDDAMLFRRNHPYPSGYFFTNKTDSLYVSIHELHERIGWLIHNLLIYIQKNKEDDVTAMVSVTSLSRVWFVDIGYERTLKIHNLYTRAYLSDSQNYRISGLRKKFPRYLLIQRAHTYYMQRLKYNKGARQISQLDRVLIGDLIRVSLSPYTENRKHAQSSLLAGVRSLIGSRNIVIPRLLRELIDGLENEDFDRAKGAMYTLNRRGLRRSVFRMPQYFVKFVRAIILASKADKISIQESSRALLKNYLLTSRIVVPRAFYQPSAEQHLRLIRSEQEINNEVKRADEIMTRRLEATERQMQVLETELLRQLESQNNHWITDLEIAAVLDNGIEVTREHFHPNVGAAYFAHAVDGHPHLQLAFGQSCVRLIGAIITRAVRHNSMRDIVNADLDPLYELGQTKMKVDHEDLEFSEKFIDQLADPNGSYYLVDQNRPGWLVWGDSFIVLKRPLENHIAFDAEQTTMLQSIGEVIDEQWFDKLCKNFLEEPRPERDMLNPKRTPLVAAVLMLVNWNYTKLTMEYIMKHVRDVYDGGKDKNCHRATAELLSGILGGAFATSHLESTLQEVMPILEDVIEDGLNPDNLKYWTEFLNTVFRIPGLHDPRLIWPIVSKLKDIEVDLSSNSVFKEKSRLSLLRHLVAKSGWMFQFYKPIVSELLSHLNHNYKGVREEIGRTLGSISRSQYAESFNTVSEFLVANGQAGSLGVPSFAKTEEFSEIMEKVFDQLVSWRGERSALQESSPYLNGSKTVLLWFESVLLSPSCPILLPYFPSNILPELLNLMDVKDDLEVTALAVSVFKHFGNIPLSMHHLANIVEGVVVASKKITTWHQRSRLLAVIQVFYFRQLFLLSDAMKKQLFDIVFEFLKDLQLEVREIAAETLSGMIRCSPGLFRSKMISQLEGKFIKILEDNPMPLRRNGGSGGSSGNVTPRTGTPSGESMTIIARHSAVLGLSALIQAFPYESPPPQWIPTVLTILATRAANDPGMVGRSVKTALGNFKKTRNDTWHVDMRVFNSEQLEDLEGVLWRSYFA
ncbi:uncharacterized protein V1516DRAFT_670355 [Lipomyces oligophaga]|uniref:uncharacterized protein n=1 Tax=Lipomyces oligophaga TaxID=45792 RepID=UPI0034CE6990